MAKRKKSLWKITYMTDYPYSGTYEIEAWTEAAAIKKFEKEKRHTWNWDCSIEKVL